MNDDNWDKLFVAVGQHNCWTDYATSVGLIAIACAIKELAKAVETVISGARSGP